MEPTFHFVPIAFWSFTECQWEQSGFVLFIVARQVNKDKASPPELSLLQLCLPLIP